MKAWSDALIAHFDAKRYTVAFCLKLTLTNGEVFRYTDFHSTLTIDGYNYTSRPGLFTTQTVSNADGAVDNMDVSSVFVVNELSRDKAVADLLRGADFEFFLVNYRDISAGIGLLTKGKIGKVTVKDNTWTIELRSLAQKLQQKAGKVYTGFCRSKLGSGQCAGNGLNGKIYLGGGVVLEDYTFNGTIYQVINNKLFTVRQSQFTALNANGAAENLARTNLFQFGILTFTGTGLNGINQVKRMVSSHTYALDSGLGENVHTIELQFTAPYTIQAGDTFQAHFGCNRSADPVTGDCFTVFNNFDNFEGEPFVPGSEITIYNIEKKG